MTIAEIRGKLSPDHPYGCHDRMEDLLTSDVFGTMRYAGMSCGFLEWLQGAEAPGIEQVRTLPPRTISSAEIRSTRFAFWPTLPNRREPDVALLLDLADGTSYLVIIEAKYLSGTSDFEVPETSEDGRTGNQVADQIKALAELSRDDVRSMFRVGTIPPVAYRLHLFVTADEYLPLPVYRESARHLPTPWPVSAYWLSWTSLPRHLEPHRFHPDPGRAAMIDDLLALLHRKGLLPFSAFSGLPWGPASARPEFWHDRWWLLPPLALRAENTFWTGG